MDIHNPGDQFNDNPLILNFGNLTVLTGSNNSGKTTLMRTIAKQDSNYYLITSNRVNIQGEGAFDKNYQNSANGYSDQIKHADNDNVVKNIQILQDFFGLSNSNRREILDYYNANFPNRAKVVLEDPTNSASARLLMMNNHSITKQGSGARSILEILIKLFDSKITLLCIDEPEIALEPKLQKLLFEVIKQKSSQKKIIIATHSHHFLDYAEIENNFICTRDRRNKILLTQVKTKLVLRNLVFDLLGNDLTDLGLPSKLIIVEGVSDLTYLTKVAELLNKRNYTFYDAGSDSRIKAAADGITEYLKFVSDLAPVYKDRIWIISDVQRTSSLVRKWRVALDDSTGSNNRVCELPRNGIEYFYPEELVQAIFNTKESLSNIIDAFISSNPHRYNGIEFSKTELAAEVVSRLSASDLRQGDQVVDFISALPA